MPEVKAVGSATATKKRGNPIEELMSAVVVRISQEADAIWRDPSLSNEEKQKRIAAITSDDAVREAKLLARKQYRDEQYRKSHEQSAAAQVQALKDMAKSL